MDPLSITASTIALIGACQKLQHGLEFIRQLSHVPEEMAVLLDELQSFGSVLSAVHMVAAHRADIDELGQYSHGFEMLLQRARAILDSVSDYCGISVGEKRDEKTTALSEAPPQKVDLRARYKWVKGQKKIHQYREQLSVIRADITNNLALLSL